MLKKIDQYPSDKRIAGIHSIPITDDGSIIMVWDKNEQGLTTIGGRLEKDEDIDRALDRETIEEAGIILKPKRIPLAAWYWENTNTCTVFVIAKVDKYVEIPDGFETSGRVIVNFETARQMIAKLEGDNSPRIEIINLAEQAYINCSKLVEKSKE
ncbi:NUDIX hydrolase [Vulcanibacillus modesticaldus]|uniref:NUDIX hydrolase n=1 Tax=Vulcanibacillus modesticaldus TaxID=337097 RepID=A0A1D2YW15_9BACI|nr:NUDIX domain-containing protein [Vulcanibacillus modesticaldus]OEF99892.1 NUDIX hydrolase [Vulcanibacillus modesticaldus]